MTAAGLLEHSAFAHECIVKALERYANNCPAPWEDPLTTAAMWMVARQETLKALKTITEGSSK